jgi:hypothetical protein
MMVRDLAPADPRRGEGLAQPHGPGHRASQ